MKDYEILSKEGHFVGGAFVFARVWKTEPEKYPKREYSKESLKIGFVVGKKIHKSAVKRNRVKRQMREVVRLMLKDGRLASGFMLFIAAKPLILEKDYEEITKDIEYVLQKGRVLKKSH